MSNEIVIEKLEVGTKITVKTKNSTYEIETLGEDNISLTGGSMSNNEVRYPEPTIGKIIGSGLYKNIDLNQGKIEVDKCLMFDMIDKEITTSIVKEVVIESKDGKNTRWIN